MKITFYFLSVCGLKNTMSVCHRYMSFFASFAFLSQSLSHRDIVINKYHNNISFFSFPHELCISVLSLTWNLIVLQ